MEVSGSTAHQAPKVDHTAGNGQAQRVKPNADQASVTQSRPAQQQAQAPAENKPIPGSVVGSRINTTA